ncbi:hypothetical protein ANN_16868 [Periplaneta americana]|uniref:Mos1 transposase HTH domain-containing protein n=1 Tax=Periplaneta americana TaxID=6978 RepID=A0ABQ8SRB6_PERAM|nr:hypothetical protein ANN_16868 [Periplaneta americana]
MLLSSTCDEQRSVVRFLWAKEHNRSESHRDMCDVYGEDCMNRSNISRVQVSQRYRTTAHLNAIDLARIEPASLGIEGQRYTDSPTRSTSKNVGTWTHFATALPPSSHSDARQPSLD